MSSAVDKETASAAGRPRIAGWKCVTALLLILILGAGLRFHRITELEPGIWDEGSYLLEARFISGFCAEVWKSARLFIEERMSGEDVWKKGEQLERIREGTKGLPPKYGRILHATFLAAADLAAGERPYIGNVVNAVFGTLTILAVFFLGRLMYDDRVGLAAALLFAVMGYHIHYSRSGLAEADTLSKLIPAGPNTSLHEAMEAEPKIKALSEQGPVFQELIDSALVLEGLNRHASTHAAGIVIGKESLTQYVPLYRDSKTGSISTQYTMDQLEECGLVKMTGDKQTTKR